MESDSSITTQEIVTEANKPINEDIFELYKPFLQWYTIKTPVGDRNFERIYTYAKYLSELDYYSLYPTSPETVLTQIYYALVSIEKDLLCDKINYKKSKPGRDYKQLLDYCNKIKRRVKKILRILRIAHTSFKWNREVILNELYRVQSKEKFTHFGFQRQLQQIKAIDTLMSEFEDDKSIFHLCKFSDAVEFFYRSHRIPPESYIPAIQTAIGPVKVLLPKLLDFPPRDNIALNYHRSTELIAIRNKIQECADIFGFET